MRLRPLRALRPPAALAARVASPPYDVVSREEARAAAAREPLSFLRVVRAEIDLPEDVDPHDPRVYAAARARLHGLVAAGALARDPSPALFVYREVSGGRAQHGVAGGVAVADYEADVIRKHERTRPDKEDDRTRHILATEAHAEPVLLAYRGRPEIDALVEAATASPPLADFAAPDGVRHTVWGVADPGALVAAFAGVPAAYVADGHHRTASAQRVAEALRPARGREGEHEWLPAVLVPAAQLEILPYHRLIRDLGGRGVADVLADLGRAGALEATPAAAAPAAGHVGIYVKGAWHRLALPAEDAADGDAIHGLDVWRLERRVLGPVLGIGDQRTDARIDFVGGAHGAREIESRVDAGRAALGIAMHATSIAELMAVADAGGIMPPKSTWFDPKLASGLFVHSID